MNETNTLHMVWPSIRTPTAMPGPDRPQGRREADHSTMPMREAARYEIYRTGDQDRPWQYWDRHRNRGARCRTHAEAVARTVTRIAITEERAA